MKHIFCVHGFGAKKGSDLAGFKTFIDKVKLQEKDAVVYEFEWDDLNDFSFEEFGIKENSKIILVGRSWGGAACYKFADDNKDCLIDLLVTFDPIPNPLWGQWGRWKLRPNIKKVVSFIQHENLLLRGRKIKCKMSLECFNPETKINRRWAYGGDFFDEYEIPNDIKLINSLGHVMITKNEWVITKALQYIEGVK